VSAGVGGGAARVVSLVPSVTETLLAWGIRPVAVTRFCEHPGLATVGGTKDPDVEAIVALRPDLVVVNDEENRRPDHDALVAAGLLVHVTHVESVADVGPMLDALARAVGHVGGRTAAGAHWGARAAAQAGIDVVPRRRAFVPIWRRPWMTFNAATYGASVLAALGIDGVFADAVDRYPTVELDAVAARRPDLVLLPSEPYPFAERHRGELRVVASDVRLIDGRDLFWWGVRTGPAVERLRQVLSA
jgi:ABC-type Fe3+-hydroxamate transport system substrate-binding protein